MHQVKLLAHDKCDTACVQHLMAEANWVPDNEERTSRGVSLGSTSLAAMPTPYCSLMASPSAITLMVVEAVWSTADTCKLRAHDR